MKLREMFAAGSTLALTMFALGCGSNNSNSSSGSFTQAQALAVTSDLFDAMSNATIAAGLVRDPVVVQAEASSIRTANLSNAVTPSSSTQTALVVTPKSVSPITIPTYTYSCPSGGTIVVSGTFTVTTTGTAASYVISNVETINSCNDGSVTMNGNPNVSMTNTESVNGDIYTGTDAITGGVLIGGNNCSINVNIISTVNSTTNAVSGTISGSVCGVTLNGKLY